MAQSKEKLLRVLQLLQATDEKSPMNASQLIDALESEYQISGVDRHSIYQDVAVLEYCGYPLQQCKDRRQGWYMAERDLKDWELCVLIDSLMQSKCLTNAEADDLKKRLLNKSSTRGKKRFQNVFHALPSRKMEGERSFGECIDLLLEAMYCGKKILFQERSPYCFRKTEKRWAWEDSVPCSASS